MSNKKEKGLSLNALMVVLLMVVVAVVEVIRFSINLITSLVFKRKVFVKQDMLKSISK
jgi:hypothetical protein